MSTQKRKFELFARLQKLGFTYEESVSLRRIEMTLQRWAEAECGDSNAYCSTAIERDETTGKPYRVTIYNGDFHTPVSAKTRRYPVADREAGALRRLKAIVDARNERILEDDGMVSPDYLFPYHQTDCRGCMLYLVKRSDIPEDYFTVVWCGDGYSIARKDVGSFSGEGKPAYNWRTPDAEKAKEFAFSETLSAFYNRGLAVCA